MNKNNTIITMVLVVAVVITTISPTYTFAQGKEKKDISKTNQKNKAVGFPLNDNKKPENANPVADFKSENKDKKDSAGLDMDCVIKTVSVREDVMFKNVGDFAETVKKAITEHKLGLVSALKQSEPKARNDSRKDANDTYRVSMKKAKQEFELSRKNAMNTFKESIKTCGAGADKAADSQDLPSL